MIRKVASAKFGFAQRVGAGNHTVHRLDIVGRTHENGAREIYARAQNDEQNAYENYSSSHHQSHAHLVQRRRSPRKCTPK